VTLVTECNTQLDHHENCQGAKDAKEPEATPDARGEIDSVMPRMLVLGGAGHRIRDHRRAAWFKLSLASLAPWRFNKS